MNQFIKASIDSHELLCKNFVKDLYLSARKDDGIIDKDEAKTIKKLDKATRKYIKELRKISKKG